MIIMDQENLDKIEVELQIKLPSKYREFMSSTDDEVFKGNCDTDIWDDAEEIIKRNKELRLGQNMGGKKPWPHNLFFIGDPLTACGNAIDINDDRTPVHWIDHCDIPAKSSGEVHSDFVKWANEIIENMY